MSGLNQCNFIGNLGRDPELTYTQGGKAVCKFSLAVNDRKDQTEWVNVIAWEKLAEICGQYLKKGSKVFISGRMATRSWEKDGVKKYATEIIAAQLQMLDGVGKKEDEVPF